MVTPPPPRSTLFPYTTLFRSSFQMPSARTRSSESGSRKNYWRVKKRGRSEISRRRTRDRKSTRLNSSHGYISYAVFCLEKKVVAAAQEITGELFAYELVVGKV